MAILRIVRHRGRGVALPRLPRRSLTRSAWAPIVGVYVLAACSDPMPNQHPPDAVLERELGLTPDDVVYTVRVKGGPEEEADPEERTIEHGTWVQFVSSDWFVHEVLFELDSLSSAARAFLVESGQAHSPPLVQEDARFVVSFDGAPAGRYPYRLEGNRSPGRGVIIVSDSIVP